MKSRSLAKILLIVIALAPLPKIIFTVDDYFVAAYQTSQMKVLSDKHKQQLDSAVAGTVKNADNMSNSLIQLHKIEQEHKLFQHKIALIRYGLLGSTALFYLGISSIILMILIKPLRKAIISIRLYYRRRRNKAQPDNQSTS